MRGTTVLHYLQPGDCCYLPCDKFLGWNLYNSDTAGVVAVKRMLHSNQFTCKAQRKSVALKKKKAVSAMALLLDADLSMLGIKAILRYDSTFLTILTPQLQTSVT